MSVLNLNDNQLNAVIAKAIIDTMTPDRQAELLTNAVSSLINKKASDRYDSPTVIQNAFNNAVADVARQVATEKVNSDPDMRAAIDKLYLDSWKKLTEGDGTYALLTEKISSAMERAITGNRY